MGRLVLCATAITLVGWYVMAWQSDAIKNAKDATQWIHPSAVKLGWLLGHRINVNERNRLLTLSEDDLLSGFKKRPGTQAWIGEHVGKWLHAAVLTWANTGNRELSEKINRVVQGLIATQEDDGYLGTYDLSTRWTMEKERGWDVWVHKYVLIGLLTYHRFAQDARSQIGMSNELAKAALDASRRAADLILRTFGTGLGQLDLMQRSTHVGMASSSILQPMVWLYRATGDRRYLDFCRHVVWAWEHSPSGPKLISALLSHGDVHRTANAKAYEMMSCLVGALELFRVLRDEGKTREGEPLLLAAMRAWDDIVTNHLYITGGTSLHELFQPDHYLPNDGAVSETCATVTLLQLTLELFRLTGNAKYMDISERIIFNHLLAAQHPNGDKWCYFTPLEGRKNYRSDINCCASSGPRGIALLPTFAYTLDSDGAIRVNIYSQSQLHLDEHGIRILQETAYPYEGVIVLKLHCEKPSKFALRLRVPDWCDEATVAVNSEAKRRINAGYHELLREWRNGDVVQLELPMKLRAVIGTHTNEGKIALMYGPLILAVDERFLPKDVKSVGDVSLPDEDVGKLSFKVVPIADDAIWSGEVAFETDGTVTSDPKSRFKLRMVDFAHAGAKGNKFTVWLKQR